MQYVLVVKNIEGITNVTLCAICTGCETHRGNNKCYLCAICTGCETHRGITQPVTLCANNVTGCETLYEE